MRLLFGPPDIPDYERASCIEYYKLEQKLKVYQDIEAEEYNNCPVKYGNSVGSDEVSAEVVLKAGKRQSDSTKAILKYRKENMSSAPEAATGIWMLWQNTYENLADWADAAVAGIEAVAEGKQPALQYINNLLAQSEAMRKKAEREEKNLLKRLKPSAVELQDIVVAGAPLDRNDRPVELQDIMGAYGNCGSCGSCGSCGRVRSSPDAKFCTSCGAVWEDPA